MLAVKSKYRYRDPRGSTKSSLDAFKNHLPKIGEVIKIKGYVYRGKHGNNSAVMVCGEHGTMRLTGLGWGYSGEGPRGTTQVLQALNVPESEINRIQVIPHSWDKTGLTWEIKIG